MLRGLPSTVTLILPLWYQPKDPVENSRLSAMISCPLIDTLIGSAFSRNWVRETGHGDFAMVARRVHQRAKPGPIKMPDRHVNVTFIYARSPRPPPGSTSPLAGA